ncbi:MAG: LPS assembly lipoprotein LptE, partial [Pseudomonadota bacterium]
SKALKAISLNTLPRRSPFMALLLACLTLSACGFQLRGLDGVSGLPEEWNRIHLVTDNPNSELARIMTSTMTSNGVTVTSREEASYILRLGPEQFSQRNLSVNAQARAAEFDLQMGAFFEVFDAEGRTVMERSRAGVNKQMENDPQNVVGKAEEVRILRGELRSELAVQVYRRISFFAANSSSALSVP